MPIQPRGKSLLRMAYGIGISLGCFGFLGFFWGFLGFLGFFLELMGSGFLRIVGNTFTLFFYFWILVFLEFILDFMDFWIFLDFSLDLRDFVRISLIFWIFLGFSGSWSFSKGISSLEWLEIFALLLEFLGIFWIFNGFLNFWDYFGSLGNYLGFL